MHMRDETIFCVVCSVGPSCKFIDKLEFFFLSLNDVMISFFHFFFISGKRCQTHVIYVSFFLCFPPLILILLVSQRIAKMIENTSECGLC
jgi:hypothetical protein